MIAAVTTALCAAAGVLGAAVIIWLGRRDLAHPAVAFGGLWFGFVALAQLRLTEFEHAWGWEMTALTLGGGALFVVSAAAAAGTASVRGRRPDLSGLSDRRLLVIAALLIAGGVIGVLWKAHLTGGIPLFAENVDHARARARGEAGGQAVPAPLTFLTNGFHLALWALMLAAYLAWRRWSLRVRLLVLAMAAVCLVGALAGVSRNIFIFTLAVPAIVVYLWTPRLPRRIARGTVGGAVALALFASVALAIRTDDIGGGTNFLTRAAEEQPVVVRPLLPLYIGGAYALESERRLVAAFPERFSYGLGGYSLASLPDKAFPQGKPPRAVILASLTWERGGDPSWTVATYQGRAYADLGGWGVLFSSIALGVLLGLVYRYGRERPSLPAMVAVAYAAYYAAFMLYDNLLSFTLASVYDLMVVVAIAVLARRRGQGTATANSAG